MAGARLFVGMIRMLSRPETADAPDWPSLVSRARDGEERAWEEVLARARPWARARLAARVRDHHAREDLVQDILVTLCRKLETLREPERFAGWFCALVDNAAHGWGRRRQAQLRLEDALRRTSEAGDVEAPSDEGAGAAPEAEERRARLAAAFRALSREHRAVLRSRYLTGHSYTETASLLDLPEGRVRGRLQKARTQLKLKMESLSMHHETYTLNAADIAALAAAALCTRNDGKQPILAGLCIEPGGQIVATDGRRIVFRRATGLASLTRRLVVGPCGPSLWSGLEEGARLSPGLASCRVEDVNGAAREWPLLDEDKYPAVDHLAQILPVASAGGARFRVGALRKLLTRMEPMLEARHPVPEGLDYGPTVRIRARRAEGVVLFETDRLLGYSGEGAQVEAALRDEPDWRFSLELRAEPSGSAGGAEEKPEFVVALNAHYLRDALDALSLRDEETAWLRWQDTAEQALAVDPAETPAQGLASVDRLTLLMPVRLT